VVQLVVIYVVVLSVTAVLALGVALGAWQQRPSPNAWSVVVMMLGVSAWCGTEAAMWSSDSLAQQAFWLRLTYPAVSVTVVALVVFALGVSGFESWVTPRGVTLIALPHVLVCVAALSNPGGLFYQGYVAQQVGSYTHYVAQNGLLFWAYIGVAYGMLVLSLGLLVRATVRSTPEKRFQLVIVLVGVSVPFLVSIANQLSPVQVEGIESTAFFITGLAFMFAVVRGRLLDPSGRVVTAEHIMEAQRRELELRAHNQQLGTELQESQHRANRLYDQATHDPLTNLSNRRALEEDLRREVSRSARGRKNIAFLMFDLDDFKPVNDRYSHLAGDAALKMVSELLMRGSRQEDIMCRWGGDEFLVVMPGADVEAACQRAEQLREEICNTRIRFDDDEFSVAATVGVSVYPEHGTTSDLAILAADRALYHAKAHGGNRVGVAAASGAWLYAATV
jgi:diguanylate cyclase (GGDEF)-like protein